MSNGQEYNWDYQPSYTQLNVLYAIKRGATLKCTEGGEYRVWLETGSESEGNLKKTPVSKATANVLSIQECIGPDDTTRNSMKLIRRAYNYVGK